MCGRRNSSDFASRRFGECSGTLNKSNTPPTMGFVQLSSVGEVATRHGQNRPWLEAQLGYTMSPETAARLRQARGA